MATIFVGLRKYQMTFLVITILTLLMIARTLVFLSKTKLNAITLPIVSNHLMPRDFPLVRTCNITRLPGNLMRKEDMQKVASTEWTFVYSAYYDAETPNEVKIVGICQNDNLTYYCQLWFKENNEGTLKMTTANASVIITSKPKAVRGLCCYIVCQVTERRSPFAVSVVVGTACSPANNMVEITYIGNRNYIQNFTMCLCPFHDNISDADRLLEWIEFNRILGADNFLLYNFTGGHSLHSVINYYIKLGLVKAFQWPLPQVYGRSLHHEVLDDYAQVSAYNDCILRSKATSKYVVITDFDEFIVPHVNGSRTWLDMFRILPKTDAYTFRHSYFPFSHSHNEFEYPEKEIAQKYNIVSIMALKRFGRIFPHGRRSKYITRTDASNNLRTHYQMGATTCHVDSKIALLHHYRRRKHFEDHDKKVVEMTVQSKYGRELASRIAKAWSNIGSSRNAGPAN